MICFQWNGFYFGIKFVQGEAKFRDLHPAGSWLSVRLALVATTYPPEFKALLRQHLELLERGISHERQTVTV